MSEKAKEITFGLISAFAFAGELVLCILTWRITRNYEQLSISNNYIFGAMGIATIVFAGASFTFLMVRGNTRATGIIRGFCVAITVLFAAACCFVYVAYIPKYTASDAEKMIHSDPKYAKVDIPRVSGNYRYNIDGNPFGVKGYWIICNSSEGKSCWFFFNPVNGETHYSDVIELTVESDTFSSQYSYVFYSPTFVMAHCKLEFKEDSGNPLVVRYFEDKSSYNGKEMEEDAKAIFDSMGEVELKKQLMEGVRKYIDYYNEVKTYMMPPSSDLVIDFYNYYREIYTIATYQNGGIVLK